MIPVHLRCRRCGLRFDVLHETPRVVVGYHACPRDVAERLASGRIAVSDWRASANDYEWLGRGVYFWEFAPGRAAQWAAERFGAEGAVVAARVRLGRCMDLGDTKYTELLEVVYANLVGVYATRGIPLPVNGGRQGKLRRLDCLVIDQAVELYARKGVLPLQTVRCPFEEGESTYPGGAIFRQSHVQIAVRDPRCILKGVYLVPEGGVGND